MAQPALLGSGSATPPGPPRPSPLASQDPPSLAAGGHNRSFALSLTSAALLLPHGEPWLFHFQHFCPGGMEVRSWPEDRTNISFTACLSRIKAKRDIPVPTWRAARHHVRGPRLPYGRDQPLAPGARAPSQGWRGGRGGRKTISQRSLQPVLRWCSAEGDGSVACQG